MNDICGLVGFIRLSEVATDNTDHMVQDSRI
jgi:hypothetical protein